MHDKPYWTILIYSYDPNSNKKYPYLAWVLLLDGQNIVMRLPKIHENYYICKNAKTDIAHFWDKKNEIENKCN